MKKIIFYSCILLLTGCVSNELGSNPAPKRDDSIKILSSSVVDMVEPGVTYIYCYMVYGDADQKGTIKLSGIYHVGDLVEGDFGQGNEILRITSEGTKVKVAKK